MPDYDGPVFKGSNRKNKNGQTNQSFKENKSNHKNKRLNLQRQTQEKTQYRPAFLTEQSLNKTYHETKPLSDLNHDSHHQRENYQVPFLKGAPLAEMQAKMTQVNRKQNETESLDEMPKKTNRTDYIPSINEQSHPVTNRNSIEYEMDSKQDLSGKAKFVNDRNITHVPTSYQWQRQVQQKNTKSQNPFQLRKRDLAKRMNKTKDSYILFEETE